MDSGISTPQFHNFGMFADKCRNLPPTKVPINLMPAEEQTKERYRPCAKNADRQGDKFHDFQMLAVRHDEQ